ASETAERGSGPRARLAPEARAAGEAGERQLAARPPAGGPSLPLRPIPGGFAGTLTFDGGMPLERMARLTIDGTTPEEVAFASVSALVPFAAVQPTANGLRVERTLHRIDGSTAPPLGPGDALHRRDGVLSRVRVTRALQSTGHSNLETPSRFVVLQDAIPAVGEAIDEDRPYLADAHLQADDPSYWARVKETLRYPDRT